MYTEPYVKMHLQYRKFTWLTASLHECLIKLLLCLRQVHSLVLCLVGVPAVSYSGDEADGFPQLRQGRDGRGLMSQQVVANGSKSSFTFKP